MAAYEGSERYFKETADRITDGAEEELVAKLTGEVLDMMEQAVTNPDRYQVLARLAPQTLMGILAEHRPHIDADVADAVLAALKREDDALQAILAAQKAGAAASTTDYAQIYAAQAAKGVTEILQRQNVALVDELAKLWYRVAGNAVTRAILGDSKRDIMEDAIRSLSDGGLETIDYKSRHRTSIDAATRRHIVTQANQARNRLLTQRCSQYDCDLVFTSAHFGSRPDHALWQGKAYGLHGPVVVDGVKYPGLVASTGYGTVTGLAGANCRHTMTPYVPGLSKLPRTDFSAEEKLYGMTSDQYYQATQKQRALERQVRKYKRRIALGEEQGYDMTADRARLGQAQKRVRAWCKQNNLPRQPERERAYGVAKQPRALGRTIARENLGWKWARDCKVDTSKVGSKAHKRVIANAFGDCSDTVNEDVARMMKHRDGTPYEDLYVYDLTDGERIGSATNQKVPFGVLSTKKIDKLIAERTSSGHKVVAIHNHPGSAPPSAADAKAAADRKMAWGLTCGHDGSIYRYEVVSDPAPGYDLTEESWNYALMAIATDGEGAYIAIEMKWGVRIDRLL